MKDRIKGSDHPGIHWSKEDFCCSNSAHRIARARSRWSVATTGREGGAEARLSGITKPPGLLLLASRASSGCGAPGTIAGGQRRQRSIQRCVWMGLADGWEGGWVGRRSMTCHPAGRVSRRGTWAAIRRRFNQSILSKNIPAKGPRCCARRPSATCPRGSSRPRRKARRVRAGR